MSAICMKVERWYQIKRIWGRVVQDDSSMYIKISEYISSEVGQEIHARAVKDNMITKDLMDNEKKINVTVGKYAQPIQRLSNEEIFLICTACMKTGNIFEVSFSSLI